MTLRELGFDDWFEARAEAMRRPGCDFARVCAVDRGAYLVRDGAREAQAELTGRLSFDTETPDALPCVGDWVTANFYNDGADALIHQVFARRTHLRRKTAGEHIGHQMIAANVDAAFLLQACGADFNPRRLERYLVMAADGGVEPVVVLTKTDLADGPELEHGLAEIAALTPARTIALSNVSGAGLAELRRALLPGGTYCLLGSSGVGKTTLLNRLTGGEAHATRPVSATGEGTHTTTRRQLVVLPGGALLVDTPGMRELGLVGASGGLDSGFAEIVALAEDCRYADCTHLHEPGCAVLAAVESGALDRTRYANYLKLRKESEYNDLSQLDKRRKDKAFGKYLKHVKKHLKP